ncbi:MAG: hypothetical protein AAF366_02145 [Pseudomonadota bacterium]
MSKTTQPPAKPALTDKEVAARNAAALARVAEMDDPDKLRNLRANAERMGVEPVRDAAFARLAVVQAEGEVGSVENDIWQMIHAVEEIKRETQGKTIRLSYLRRDIQKVGEAKAIGKLVAKSGPSERFDELMARGLPHYTAEAITLRHPDAFDDATRDAAKARLEDAGVDIAALVA